MHSLFCCIACCCPKLSRPVPSSGLHDEATLLCCSFPLLPPSRPHQYMTRHMKIGFALDLATSAIIDCGASATSSWNTATAFSSRDPVLVSPPSGLPNKYACSIARLERRLILLAQNSPNLPSLLSPQFLTDGADVYVCSSLPWPADHEPLLHNYTIIWRVVLGSIGLLPHMLLNSRPRIIIIAVRVLCVHCCTHQLIPSILRMLCHRLWPSSCRAKLRRWLPSHFHKIN